MVRRFGIGRPSMSESDVARDLERSGDWVLARQASALRKLRAHDPLEWAA